MTRRSAPARAAAPGVAIRFWSPAGPEQALATFKQVRQESALWDQFAAAYRQRLREVMKTQQEMQANIATLKYLESRVRSLNQDNANLAAKYGGDAKLLRVHKRLEELKGDQPIGIDIGVVNFQSDAVLVATNAFVFNLIKAVNGDGVTVGPILLGAAKPVHILTPTATVRRLVNMTALSVVDANHLRR